MCTFSVGVNTRAVLLQGVWYAVLLFNPEFLICTYQEIAEFIIRT